MANYNITRIVSPSGAGSISGPTSAPSGQTIRFSATPGSNYNFSHWLILGIGTYTNNPVTITMPEKTISVYAYFVEKPKSYTISVQTTTGGGTVSGGRTYTEGSSATVTASPYSSYQFNGWYENGSRVSTSTSYTFTVSRSRYLDAHFSKVPSYKITLEKRGDGDGSVSGDGSYLRGTSITIRATPNSNSTFINWIKDGSVVTTSTSFTITVSQNATYIANFAPKPKLDVTSLVTPAGGGTVTGTTKAYPGDTVTLTASANVGRYFSYWEYGDNRIYDNPLRITMPSYSIIVTAHFAINSYIITTNVSPNDGGTVSGGGSYNYGSSVRLTATPNDAYDFDKWDDGDTSPIKNIVVSSNKIYTAYFKDKVRHVIFNVYPGNSGDVYISTPTEDVIVTEYDLEYGKTYIFTAEDALGYKFSNWNNTIQGRRLILDTTIENNTVYTAYETNIGTCKVTLEQSEGGNTTLIKHLSNDKVLQYAITTPKPVGVDFTCTNYLTFQAVPSRGYKFDHWEVNGYRTTDVNATQEFLLPLNDVTYKAVYTPTEPTTYYRVQVDSNKYSTDEQFHLSGGYIEFITPGGRSGTVYITERTNLEFPEGTEVSIYHYNILPVNGTNYYFTAWSDAQTDNIYGRPGRRWTSLIQDINLTIYYNQEMHITCISNPHEGGYFLLTYGSTSEEGYNFVVGRDKIVTIQATPHRGYQFVEWTDHVLTPIRQETITSDVTFSAIFRDTGGEKQTFHIVGKSVPADGGTVTGQGYLQVGTMAVLTAVPNEDYVFSKWENGSTNPVLRFEVSRDITVTAYFTYTAGIPPSYLSLLWFIKRKKRPLEIRII